MRAGLGLLGALFYALASTAWATVMVVEGSAPVRNGDVGQARELAVRRAMAWAAESRAAVVHAQTNVQPAAVLESIQLSASACTQDTELLDERLADGELRVTVRVTLLEEGACRHSCRKGYTNRIVVTGFAMEFPEQKLPSEGTWLANLTAVELSKAVGKRRGLLADHEGSVFPYKSPARAPEPRLYPQDRETVFSALARKHRGQYVVSGVYRDFALRGSSWWGQSRRMEIEAFLHDGANGAVLARRSFVREASGGVVLANRPMIGSPEFYAGDLGKAWGALLDDIARWVDEEAGCLPFMAHVIKADGGLIYLDAGAESGLTAGDTLTLHGWQGAPVRSLAGLPLGQEKNSRATASIKHVYPLFSVAELVEAPRGLEIKLGDILYGQIMR